jgi:hypothetical protein
MSQLGHNLMHRGSFFGSDASCGCRDFIQSPGLSSAGVSLRPSALLPAGHGDLRVVPLTGRA